MVDPKKKSLSKTVSWRMIAFVNSYIVLAMIVTLSPLWNAIIMNITGAIMYYIHERLWVKIK